MPMTARTSFLFNCLPRRSRLVNPKIERFHQTGCPRAAGFRSRGRATQHRERMLLPLTCLTCLKVDLGGVDEVAAIARTLLAAGRADGPGVGHVGRDGEVRPRRFQLHRHWV